MYPIVVVFDFDKTIIDCDSDNWVVDELGATELFNTLLPTMPWNSLMDRMMCELHTMGRSIQDIVNCLKRAPIDHRIIAAIKSAYELGCELRIVSDANVLFIETILEHHGLLPYFSEINTNPSRIDEQGRLRISPYHESPHGCTLCPSNMCKGKIVDRIRAEVADDHNMKQFIYLGDGKGDYCPSLRMRETDFVMPRKDFPVWELICDKPELVWAVVREWRNGEEMERILLQLVREMISSSAGQLIPLDSMFESRFPIEVIPPALRVRVTQ